MILSYRFENFLSFHDNVEFSMEASKTQVKKRFPNNYVSADAGIDLLKTAVIVGENAGGKSNFVRSLEYFQSFFNDPEKGKSYRNMININNNTQNCPQQNNTLQMFEIEIVLKDIGMYLFHLEVDFCGIVKEYLLYKKQSTQKYKSVFFVERSEQSLDCQKNSTPCPLKNECHTHMSAKYRWNVTGFEPEMTKLLQKATDSQKPIGLFITKLAILGEEHSVNFTDWVKHSLCPETKNINYGLYKSIKKEDDDLRILKDDRFLDIFRMIDYSINGLKLDEEKPFTKSVILRKKKDGSTFDRELERDSSGVTEFFAWAIQIFRVVYENKVIFADEMDRVLNPVLSDRVISYVNGTKHFGQFIITSHNVLHLDLKNFMKEQIYFITKDSETLESELYSLADFPEIRYETTKIYEFYMKGILGGTAIDHLTKDCECERRRL